LFDDAQGDQGQIAGGWSLSISTTGGDYVAGSGPVTFAPGVTSQTVTVAVNGDTAVEPNETFFVNLSGVTGATVADAQGQGTIVNDDSAAQVRTIQFVATASSVGEAAGPALAGVRVTTSDGLATAASSSVGFATANGTATAGSDYTSSAGTITFPAGSASGAVQSVSVPIASDSVDEADETFTISLGSPSGAVLGTNATHTVTIVDDDVATGLDYYTVTPCRLIDTRLPAGPDPPFGGPALSPAQIRVFDVAGHCGISPSARAISINVTVTQGGAAGFVRLYPANETLPLVSTINYSAGATRGNNAIVGLSPTGQLAVVSQQGTGTVHLILDVNGYFE
jgi:hypothetical protein